MRCRGGAEVQVQEMQRCYRGQVQDAEVKRCRGEEVQMRRCGGAEV